VKRSEGDPDESAGSPSFRHDDGSCRPNPSGSALEPTPKPGPPTTQPVRPSPSQHLTGRGREPAWVGSRASRRSTTWLNPANADRDEPPHSRDPSPPKRPPTSPARNHTTNTPAVIPDTVTLFAQLPSSRPTGTTSRKSLSVRLRRLRAFDDLHLPDPPFLLQLEHWLRTHHAAGFPMHVSIGNLDIARPNPHPTLPIPRPTRVWTGVTFASVALLLV
jgi:hypothetical protein